MSTPINFDKVDDKKPSKALDFNALNEKPLSLNTRVIQQSEKTGYLADLNNSNTLLKQILASKSGLDETLAAANQGWWTKTGNAIVQTAAVAGGDLVQTAGSLFSIPERIHALYTGEAEDFTNVVSQWGEDIIKAGETNFPIHRANPNKSFDFGDWGYWASQAPGAVGSSLGMMAGGYGVFKGGLKALGLTKRFALLTPTAQKLWQAGVMSGVMRDTENYMEAHGVYSKTYDDNQFLKTLSDKDYKETIKNLPNDIKKNVDINDREAVIKQIASAAGYRDYRNNAVNFVFDFIEMSALLNLKIGKANTRASLYGKPISVMSENIMQTTGKAATKLDLIKNIGFRTGKVILQQGIPESAEEFVNAVSEQEGLHYGKYLAGKAKEDGYWGRFAEYTKNPTVWEQAFWGAIGGVGTSSLIKGVGKLKDIKGRKEQESDEIGVIQERNSNIAKLNNIYSSLNKGINPTTKKKFEGTPERIAEEIEMAKDDAVNMLSASLANGMIRTEGVTIGLAWLRHENTTKQLVDSGFGTQKEVKEILNTVANNIENDEKFYNTNLNGLFSPIKNEGIKGILILDAMGNKRDLDLFAKRAAFYSKEKSKIFQNPSYLKLDSAKQAELIANIERFSQIQTYKQLRDYVLQSKLKYQNHKTILNLFDAKLKDFETKFNFNQKDTTEEQFKEEESKIIAKVHSAVLGGLSRQILDDYTNSLIYSEASQFKHIEQDTVLNNKSFQKTVETELNDGAKKSQEDYKQEVKNKLKVLVINASKDSKEAGYLTRTEFEDELKKIETGTSFNKLGINLNDVRVELDKRLHKQKVTDEKAPVTPNENALTEEENKLIEANKEYFSAFDESSNEDLSDYIETSLNPLIADTSNKEAAASAALTKKYLQNLILNNPTVEEEDAIVGDIVDNFSTLNKEDVVLDEVVQGGENSFNAYVAQAAKVAFTSKRNGVRVLDSRDKNADALNVTLQLQAGDEIVWRKATPDDFNTYDEYARLMEESNGEIIVGSHNDVPVLFMNTERYLVNELVLTDNLLQNLDDSSFEELFNLIKDLYVDSNSDELNKEIVEKIKLNNVFTNIYKESISDIDDKLKHLRNILFFGLPHDKIVYNKSFLQNSLKDWQTKIEKDYNNRPKIIDKLKASTNGQITTQINYTSTGTLIIATNANGKLQYNRLDNTLSSEKGDIDGVKLYVVDKDNSHIVTPAISSDKETLQSFARVQNDKYKAQIFSSVTAANGQEVLVPLVMNKIKTIGTVEKESYIGKTEQKRIDYIIDNAKQVLSLLNNGGTQQDSKYKELKDNIGEQVIVNQKNEQKTLYIKFYPPTSSTTARMEFRTKDGKGIHNLYMNTNGDLTLYEEYNGEVTEIPSSTFKGKLNEAISNMRRSFDYTLLSKNDKYTDKVTGVKYKSYKHFLIKSNALMTYVGKIVNKEGQKISNFEVKSSNNLFSSRPLIISIDTSFKPQRFEDFENGADVESLMKGSKYTEIYNKFKELGLSIEPEFRIAVAQERGGYDPTTKTVYFTNLINASLDTKTNADLTVVHEMIHGILNNSPLQKEWVDKILGFNSDLLETINKIKLNEIILDENNKQEILDLLNDNVVKQILNKIDSTNPNYKSHEFDEVITYGFTNTKFARLLQLLPSNKGTKTEKESFWTTLKNLIADIVKAITGYSKLDELTDILDDIFRPNTENNKASTTEEGARTTTREQEGRDTTDAKDDDDFIEISFENIRVNQPLVLTPYTKHIFKHYNLLNAKGEKKIVTDSKATDKWIKTLNLSPYYKFRLSTNNIGPKTIVITKRDEISYDNINLKNDLLSEKIDISFVDNLKNITEEEVQDRIKKCK